MKTTTEMLEEMIDFVAKNEMKLMELGSDIYDNNEVFRMKFKRRR